MIDAIRRAQSKTGSKAQAAPAKAMLTPEASRIAFAFLPFARAHQQSKLVHAAAASKATSAVQSIHYRLR